MVSNSEYEEYKNVPLSTALIDRKYSKNFCPTEAVLNKSGKGKDNYTTSSLSVPLDIQKENGEVYQFSDIPFEYIPKCSDLKQNDASNGCCVSDVLCDNVFDSSYNKHDTGILFSVTRNIFSSNINYDLCKNYVDEENKGKYIFSTMDKSSGELLSMDNNDILNGYLRVCHKQDIRTSFIDKMLQGKNGAQTFLITFFLITLILFFTTFIGACYEFWLEYGIAKDCIYFKGDCYNMGPEDNELNLIDYMFPSSICYYPYQECKTKQSGGGKLISNYIKNGQKCVNIEATSFGDNKNSKAFPYNIADWANKEIGSDILKTPFKTFTFFFLFTVLVSRYFINKIFYYLSSSYRKSVKDNIIGNGVIFLLLTGLLPLIINALLGGSDEKSAGGGPFLPIILLTTTIIPAVSFIGAFISFFATFFPKSIGLEKRLEKCNPAISENYYNLINKLHYLPVTSPEAADLSLVRKVWNAFKNGTYWIINFFSVMLSLFVFGVLGYIMAMLYLGISIPFNIFAIPIKNPIELFNIIKKHADLITMFFCISVIAALKSSINSQEVGNNITGIMSVILVIVMLFKLYYALKKSV